MQPGRLSAIRWENFNIKLFLGGQGNGTQNFGGGKAPRGRGRGGNRGTPY